jgi:hypothetical protein
LKIDGVAVPLDAQGNFKTPKLANKAHVLDVRLVNTSADSSFIATYNLKAGDQVFNPAVNSNAGTGLSLASFRKFLYLVQFRGIKGIYGSDEGVLHGIDFAHANEYTDFINAKDLPLGLGFSRSDQNQLETWFNTEINAYLADSNKVQIVKGNATDDPPMDLTGTTSWTPQYRKIVTSVQLL